LSDDDDDSFLISKDILPSIEEFGFVETILGDPDGSLRQFRSSTGLHVREYEGHFEIHRDKVDPRANPIGHLVKDSPETLLAFGTASLLSHVFSRKDANDSKHAYGNPLDFLSMFFFLNRFFRALKRPLF
jgi:hypothetical protein